jgi:hypothetical protein
MKKYPVPAPANSAAFKDAPAADLEFPVVPDFLSRPPRIDPQAMLRRIEETMPWRSTRPGEKERRANQGITTEFIL